MVRSRRMKSHRRYWLGLLLPALILVCASCSRHRPPARNAELFFNTGLNDLQSGDYAKAIADFSQAMVLNTNYPDAYLYRGEAKSRLNDYAGTIADDTRAIELKPDYAYAYFTRGNARAALKDYAGTIADDTRAIELKPEYAYAYFTRGNARAALKDYSGTIADDTKSHCPGSQRRQVLPRPGQRPGGAQRLSERDPGL